MIILFTDKNNKMNVAVVMGGYSDESVISLRSGQLILKELDKNKYTPFEIHILKEEWYALIDAEKYPILNEVDIPRPTAQQLMSLINTYGVAPIAVTVDQETWMNKDGAGFLLPGDAGGHEILCFGYDTTLIRSQIVCLIVLICKNKLDYYFKKETLMAFKIQAILN